MIDASSPPRRLSILESSPHYSLSYRRVGVKLDGRPMPSNVEEYDADEGWIRTVSGRRLSGVVEPYWRRSLGTGSPEERPQPEDRRAMMLALAADRRKMKEQKRASLIEKREKQKRGDVE